MVANRRERVRRALEEPIIPGVRDVGLLDPKHFGRPRTVFVLGGSINELGEIIPHLEHQGFACFLHVDLLRGLSPDPEGIRFLADYMGPAGIITTHGQVVNAARSAGLLSILRVFALDSKGLSSGITQIQSATPDAVEILPGVVPRAIKFVAERVKIPVIAGGLITTEADVAEALQSGAVAVSTSARALW